MGQLANDIYNEATARIPSAPVPNAAALTGPQLLQVFAKVEAAVAALELLTRGAKIIRTAGAPATTDGADGDLGLNTLNADLYGKAGGTWSLIINLKGTPGTNATGQPGLSAYQLAVQQGFVGSLNQWLDSLGRAGADGRSAYQVAVDDGFVGSVPQWLESLKGAPGERGNDAIITDNSITNNLLGVDIKIGSTAAAGNAYPAADRTTLTSVEKFLVYIGGKIQDIYSRLSSVDTLSALVTGFAGRITALEARPVGGGTGSGTASYPAQSTATANMFLMSSGVAGGESWATIVNNRVGWVYSFKNELTRNQRFFKATTITSIRKDAGISTLSYSINGATAVNVAFTAGVFTPAVGTLVFPVDALVTWSITYNSGFTEGAFEVEGTEAN